MANRKNKQKRFYTLLVQVILVFMAVLALFPFLWMISTSLKGSEEAFAYPPKLIPEIFHWDNYEKAMTALPFGKGIPEQSEAGCHQCDRSGAHLRYGGICTGKTQVPGIRGGVRRLYSGHDGSIYGNIHPAVPDLQPVKSDRHTFVHYFDDSCLYAHGSISVQTVYYGTADELMEEESSTVQTMVPCFSESCFPL